MAAPRVLARPPIQEALVDIRAAAAPEVAAESFKELAPKLPEYPDLNEKREVRAELRLEGSGLQVQSPQDSAIVGVLFRPTDKSRVAQFRKDGFTLNQLTGYPGADALVDEALRLWAFHREVAKPAVVSRLSLRYINSLALPYKEGDDFSRFLTAAPPVPPELPQSVSNFLTRLVLHEGQFNSVVTQKLSGPPDAGSPTNVTIDIDVFAERDFDVSGQDFRDTLMELRELKNRIFFGLLAEEAIERYL